VTCFPPVEDLLPHAAPMVLIDRLLDHDGETARCALRVRHDAPFVRDGQVATIVALEYMAQTVGVFAGYEARRSGEEVRVGYLISCRTMKSARPWLPVGSELNVFIERVWGDTQLGKFECRVQFDDGTPVASAILNVALAPPDSTPQ